MNASVARNVGMQYVTKPYIYFVDGDVELYPEFICKALGRIQEGCANAATGVLNEIVYSDDYKHIKVPLSPRHYFHKEMVISHTGGIFLITRQLAAMIGPWDERLTVNQDTDYTLRINRYGKFIALPITMGIHHTLTYNERSWQHFRRRFPMYFGMTIRKNMNQPKMLLLLMRYNRGYSAGFVVYLLLFLGILASIVLQSSFYYVIIFVLFLVLSDLCWGARRKKNIINHFLVHYLHVPLILAGILFDANTNHPATVIKCIY
jgi:glycosyltransferase involved in cell wall biosynthesis